MEKLSKFLVRICIFYTAIYFLYSYASVIFFDKVYFNDIYIVLVELCLCIFVSVQGKYHCRYAKYTAFGIFTSDSITRLDGYYDFIPIGYAAEIPAFILASGISISIILAVAHFRKVIILNKKRDGIHKINGRGESQT